MIMTATTKVIPQFNDNINGIEFKKGIEMQMALSFIKYLEKATDKQGKNPYLFEYVKEKKIKKDKEKINDVN